MTFRGSKWLYRWGTALIFDELRSSGSLAFPAPSTTLAVTDRVLEVFPSSASSSRSARAANAARLVRPESSLMALCVSFRALAIPAGTPRDLQRGLELLLS